MDVIIVGAGPAGLTLGAALARRRHRVVAVDLDPGPAPDGSWRRRGVMQFEQAHGFRPQVRDLLRGDLAGGLGRMARSRCRAVRDAGAWSLAAGRRGAVPSSDLRASAAAGGGRRRRADRRRRPGGEARRGGRARRGRGGGRHDPPRRSRGRRRAVGCPGWHRRRSSAPTPAWPTWPAPTGGAGSAAGSADPSVRVERHVPRATTATSSLTSTATSRR